MATKTPAKKVTPVKKTPTPVVKTKAPAASTTPAGKATVVNAPKAVVTKPAGVATKPVVTPAPGSSTQSSAPTLRDTAAKYGLGVDYDAKTNMVTITDPRNPSKPLTFTSGQGKEFGMVGEVAGQNRVDVAGLMNALNSNLGSATKGVSTGPDLYTSDDVKRMISEAMSSQGSTASQSPTDLINLINQLGGTAPVKAPTMGYDEARRIASGQIAPTFNSDLQGLISRLKTDAVARGFGNQDPINANIGEVQANALGSVEGQINQAAQTLMANSAAQNSQDYSVAIDSYNQGLGRALQAIGMSQDAQQNKLGNLLQLLGLNQSQDQFNTNTELEKQKIDLEAKGQAIDAAIARTQTTGVVAPGDALLLGVPAGTSYWQAESRAKELQAQVANQKAQLQLGYAQIAADTANNIRNNANKNNSPFGGLNEWEYKALKEEEDKAKIQSITQKYGVDKITAATAQYFKDSYNSRAAALADLKANTKKYTDTGADMNSLTRIINDMFPLEMKLSGR